MELKRFKAISALEKFIGEESTQRLANNGVYKFAADGLAMNAFSLVYILNEKFIGGMDWGEAWATRGAAAVGNALTGRPYGIYNDWVRNKFGVKEKSSFRKYFADVVAFVSGQTPLYALYMIGGAALGGAAQGIKESSIDPLVDSIKDIEWNNLGKAALFLTTVAPALATPQKMTYDFVRSQLGIRQKSEKHNI